MNKRAAGWAAFAAVNLGVCAGALVLPFYRTLAATAVGQAWVFCPVNRYLHVYCPGCGVTRALSALLRFDVPSALVSNPAAVLFVVLAAYWDVRALISLIRGDEKILHVTKGQLFCLLGVLIGWGLLRDVLLLGFGIDTLGDFPQYTGIF